MSSDEFWMRRALLIAEKGKPFTSPNPLVGALIVKNGKIISEGYHQKFGSPHAEIEALNRAGKKSIGATLYVTLEPCSTYGKTPPCTEAIKQSKIKKIVIGAIDPNPKHFGKSLRFFKNNGIQIKTKVLEEFALKQNESFVKWIKTGLPFVTLKMAQSLDGKIASRTGSSRWISGKKAREWVHGLRSESDAVLVGKNTLLRDDPRLTVRNGKVTKSPWRIVLDSNGEISKSARIFDQKGQTILVCSDKKTKDVIKKFKGKNVTILPVKEKNGRVNLAQLLKHLGSLGISSLLVEGGGEVAWSFIEGNFVDKLYWVIAPKIIGGRDAKTSIEGDGVTLLDNAPKVRPSAIQFLGEDLLFEGYLN